MGGRWETRAVADWLGGTWKLIAWRRIADDGTVNFPLGADARGQLVYTANGRMAVQITGADRPALTTGDPLGGDVAARADAYSSYLAYFGSYELQGESVVHYLDGSLSRTGQARSRSAPFPATTASWSCALHRCGSETGRPW